MPLVVHLAKYYPPDQGGMESVTHILATGAAAAGHHVTVICFQRLAYPEADDGPVHIRRCHADLMINTQPLGLDYFVSGIRAGRRADIVHLHAPNLLAALAACMLGRRPKLVVHWHSDVIGKGLLGRLVRPLERAMLARADVVIATSQRYVEGSMALIGLGDKISVVPLGVADMTKAFKHGASLDERFERFLAGRRLILSVGRLTAYKGFHLLIEAAGEMDPDAAVIIAGSGELMAELAEQIRTRGLGSKIMLAGPVTDAELAALYQRTEVFCLPSMKRSEAFGVVLLEAMAYGLPIVATNIPGSGVPWINCHGVTGINVEVGDAHALAQACCQLLRDAELRNRLAKGARARFEAHFTADKFVERTLDVYQAVLNGA